MNFCPPAVPRSGTGAETLGGIVARRATIKSECQDFGRNRFGFCPKGTANFQNSDFGRLLPRPRFARARQKPRFYTDF